MPQRPRCTYLRCENAPTSVISPPYGKDWMGCGEHVSAMSAVLGGTTKPIGKAATKSGNSWDDREGATWIDQL